MKHTEQDQPIHVNADRRDEAYTAIAKDVPEWHDDDIFVDWHDWYIERFEDLNFKSDWKEEA